MEQHIPDMPEIELHHNIFIKHSYMPNTFLSGYYSHNTRTGKKNIYISLLSFNTYHVLYHEIAHAIYDKIVRDDNDYENILKLKNKFDNINRSQGIVSNSFRQLQCSLMNAKHIFISDYACTSFAEDFAETYANIFSKKYIWSKFTKEKANILCEFLQLHNRPLCKKYIK